MRSCGARLYYVGGRLLRTPPGSRPSTSSRRNVFEIDRAAYKTKANEKEGWRRPQNLPTLFWAFVQSPFGYSPREQRRGGQMKEPWSLKAGAAWGACIGLALVAVNLGPNVPRASTEDVARLVGVFLGAMSFGALVGVAVASVRNMVAR